MPRPPIDDPGIDPRPPINFPDPPVEPPEPPTPPEPTEVFVEITGPPPGTTVRSIIIVSKSHASTDSGYEMLHKVHFHVVSSVMPFLPQN